MVIKKIFDLTKNFTTPEILNKYRNTDKNVDKKIKQQKENNIKYMDLDKIINKNIDKIKENKPVKSFTAKF